MQPLKTNILDQISSYHLLKSITGDNREYGYWSIHMSRSLGMMLRTRLAVFWEAGRDTKFKARSITTMVLFFSLTAPIGIVIGIGISSANENSPIALIIQGILNASASGILIYMALVDLLAADFMNPRVMSKGWLQLALNTSAGLMSMLAKWA